MNISKPTLCPECPGCGCNATELVNAGMRYNRPWAAYLCTNDDCGHQFTVGQPPPTEQTVIYSPVRCPYCNAKECPTYKTAGSIRYHRCRKCELSFRSEEKE